MNQLQPSLAYKSPVWKSAHHQSGFTLIELMISMVLGLLISAAVIQVFMTSQRVDRIQTGGAEVQDKVIFGVQAIERQLRLTNLGNAGRVINDTTAQGGVVLSADDGSDTSRSFNVIVNDGLKSGYLTRSHDMASSGNKRWNGALSNTNVASDQLTIQYINETGDSLFDCEGRTVAPDERVIERYYIQEGAATGETRRNLDLVCDAGRINGSNLSDFGETSGNRTAVVINNVDQFNIRLGVQRPIVSSGRATYEYADMTVKDYMSLSGKKPYITSIQFAILARSRANTPEDSANSFNILGTTQTLKSQSDAPKYIRRVYESNILLRNARMFQAITSP